MQSIHIDIVSDIACPWCAIGYARLEQAMAQLSADYLFTLHWRAFELRPEYRGQGELILPALAQKYGRSEQEMHQMQAHLQTLAQSLGINFNKIHARPICNTFDAHRLVKWAAEQGWQTALTQALFNAYFGQAKDVSQPEVLLDCVSEVGLAVAPARTVLANNDYGAVVREEQAYYQQLGISSVPAFIINDQHLLTGAQEPAAWLDAIAELSPLART
ncbi:DsbA family oxidoreductase [Oceanisphaera avium]|uniref:DSBA-like thioredoxin domain-containing protein n=1 Tax=Oceanisphaera avium TaxID=1903694 RepID=A0A1Y0CXR0_9GAMM|nr:DsbA family oxidoreductase [Oceanisphaera avium]ART80111.1 hypothetical protein CBP12_08095 [Oceanisphaera avium]